MFNSNLNLNNIFGQSNPTSSVSSLKQMVSNGIIGQLVQPDKTYVKDKFNLTSPSLMFNTIPNNSSSPSSQIMEMGKKYKIPFSGDMETYQKRVVKSMIMHKAMQYGIPLNVALGIAGNESGWKMWNSVKNGGTIEGKNIRNGVLSSTDWGAMQLNDKAHPNAFPRAKNDLEYNIDCGLNLLAKNHKKIKGDLGLGFGDWDRTIASYNIGHNPSSTRDYEIANKYVSRVKTKSLNIGNPSN